MSRQAINRVLLVSSTLILGLAGQSPAQEDQKAAQREIQATRHLERVVNKLEAYQVEAKGIDDIGSLTGLWRKKGGVREGESPIRQIYQVRDVLTYSYLDQTSGKLTVAGFAERTNNQWQGWMKLHCRDCCPGTGWWDQSVLSSGNGTAEIVIKSLKMNPDKCVLTDTPDDVRVDLELIRVLEFKEFLPGKLIHIVAAPSVGGQPARYKAAVRLKWDLRGLGVANFTLAVKPGVVLLNNARNLQGEYEYVIDRPGKYYFALIANNKEGRLLHFDLRSIEIPAIPGINRI